MDIWGTIVEILDKEAEVPVSYGSFHLICIALTVLISVLACLFIKKPDEKAMRRFFLFYGISFVILEAYKQISFTYNFNGTEVESYFQWYAFPFQFCSSPMYVTLLGAFIKNKKIHEAFSAYLATFALFAGVVVLAYPVQVFVATIGVNIQTMIWHCSMICVGVYLLASGYVKLEHKTILKAISVFVCFVIGAMILNEIAYTSGLLEEHGFNMFYISPHCEPSLPVYSIVQELVAYPWCLMLYVFGFSAAAYIILLIGMGIRHLVTRKNKEIVMETV